MWMVVDHPTQRRVRDQATVPIVLALDLDRGKSGRQCTARHHVLRADAVRCRVEIGDVAGADVYRADAEAHGAAVDPVEIDQPLQCRSERSRVVITRRLNRALGPEPRYERARREEAWRAERQRPAGAPLVQQRASGIAVEQRRDTVVISRRGYEFPKLPELLDSLLGRIAGNQSSVD